MPKPKKKPAPAQQTPPTPKEVIPLPPFQLEICVDSIASALAAEAGGAHRIELCDSLLEGGLTPSFGTITIARAHLSIDINVMIRPRGGDFLYSDDEMEIMQHDIVLAKELGADGVVFGVLTEDGEIDKERTKILVDLARPLSVTVHRAFDLVADPARALDDLIELGVDRVLTSGQESTAPAGVETIAALVKQAAGRIIVMPGSGLTEHNIATIQQQTGATELHMSAKVPQDSAMRYRNPRVSLGGNPQTPEYTQQIASADRIRASIEALQAAFNLNNANSK